MSTSIVIKSKRQNKILAKLERLERAEQSVEKIWSDLTAMAAQEAKLLIQSTGSNREAAEAVGLHPPDFSKLVNGQGSPSRRGQVRKFLESLTL